MALDDCKNSIVAWILLPGAAEPEFRQFPHEPWHRGRCFAGPKREEPAMACYEVGPTGYDLRRQIRLPSSAR